jgi:hypothetical protein
MFGGLPVSSSASSSGSSVIPTSSGPSSARPNATGSGKLYFDTSLGILYIDTGQWQTVGPATGPVMTPPPLVGAFTLVGNMGIVQQGDVIRAQMTSNANQQSPCALIANGNLGAAQSWVIRGAASLSAFAAEAFPEVGFGASNGIASGVSQMRVSARFSDAASVGVHQEVILVGNGGRISVNGETTGPSIASGLSNLFRLRLLADGVTLHYQYSLDGLSWWDAFTEATPVGFTNYGFALGNGFNNSDAICQATIHELVQTVPTQVTVSGATNTNPIVLQTATPHGVNSGDFVSIHGVTGNLGANTPGTGGVWSNGIFIAVVVDATHLTLVASAGTGVYAGGGTLTLTSR